MARSDKEFALTALSLKYITQEQAEEGMRLLAKARELGLTETLPEILVKKGYLNRAQEAAVHAALNQPRLSHIGKYRLIARVGQGGMGTVYKARQESLDKIVALKVLAPGLARQKDFVDRFIREAQASGKLNHPNVVLGIDAGEADGYYYFAMEFVDGENLKDVLEREGKLAERRALEITAAVAAALEHAHAQNIVHRDIKPGNIFIGKDGTPKLGDLGLAKEIRTDHSITQAGIPVGTPYYISPEQVRGQEDIDQRADLYAVGATLYRMVAGDVPYDGPTGAVVMTRHLNDPVPDPRKNTPALSDACVILLQHCMQKDRKDRYQNARQLREDVEAVLAGKPLRHAKKHEPRAGAVARAAAARHAQAAARKRNLLIGAAVGGGALALAAVLVIVLTSGSGGGTPQDDGLRTRTVVAPPVERPDTSKTTRTKPPKSTTPTVVQKPKAADVLKELKAFAAQSDRREETEKRLTDFYITDYPGTPEANQAKTLLAELKARWKAEDEFKATVTTHIQEGRFADASAALAGPPFKDASPKVKEMLDELAGQFKRAVADHVAAQTSEAKKLILQGDLDGAKKLYEALAKLGVPEGAGPGETGLKEVQELAAEGARRAAQRAFANLVAKEAAPLVLAGKLQEAKALLDPAKAQGDKALGDLLKAGQEDIDRISEYLAAVENEVTEVAQQNGSISIKGNRRPVTRVENHVIYSTVGRSTDEFPIQKLTAKDLEKLKDSKNDVSIALLELYRGEAAGARERLQQLPAPPPEVARYVKQAEWVQAIAHEEAASKEFDDAQRLADQNKWKEANDLLTRLSEKYGHTAFVEQKREDIKKLAAECDRNLAATTRKAETIKPFIDITEKCPDLAKAFKTYKVAGGWVVDINNDGLLDIALDIRRKAGDSRLVPVFFNETKPGKEIAFRDVTQQVGLDTGDEPICWADLNGDGDLDVVCRGLWPAAANAPKADAAKLALYENTGKASPMFRCDPARSLTAELAKEPGMAGYGFANIAVLDANGDGRADILAQFVGQMRTLCLFGSRAKPFSFGDASEEAGFVVRKGKQVEPPAFLQDTAWLQYVVLDYDDDEHPDLLLTGVAGTLLRNGGRRGFAPAPGVSLTYQTYVSAATGNSPIIIPAVADYDNDGRTDVFVPQKGKNLLLRNTGDGKFLDVMPTTGPMANDEAESLWATWADVNDDGRPDLFVCNTGARNCLYIQQSNRAFMNAAPEYGVTGDPGEKTNFAAFADFDRDGDLDMLILRENGHSQLLQNPYIEGNNHYYVSVLIRTRLGAIGAKVYLSRRADQALVGFQQIGRVEGFNRQTPFEAFFGVPTAGDYAVKVVLSDHTVIKRNVTVKPDARNELTIGKADK
jgi:serine/threonine-protein kinase